MAKHKRAPAKKGSKSKGKLMPGFMKGKKPIFRKGKKPAHRM